MSLDGRYVAFVSGATNLVPNDTNGRFDVFVRDRYLGKTERVSVRSGGGQANRDSGSPNISADGHYVVFQSAASNLVPSDTNGFDDVFLHDRVSGSTIRVSVGTGDVQGNGSSSQPWHAVISANDRYVAFYSAASNLVPNDTNGFTDVFVRNLKYKWTKRVNVGPSGVQSNSGEYVGKLAITWTGHRVNFLSDATNLIKSDANGGIRDVFIHDW